MINWIWGGLITIGLFSGIYQQLFVEGKENILTDITKAAIEAAQLGVTLSIGMIGVMALFLGIMGIADRAGMIKVLGRVMQPLMVRIFPEVPPDHPAMGSMVMNMAANVLGLGNAATPLGLKAMKELQTLNPHKNVATNAMCMFLAINTSSIQLVAATVIGLRVAAGSKDPTSIIGPTLMATIIGTIFAVFCCKFLEKLPMFRIDSALEAAEEAAEEAAKGGNA